MIHFHIKSLRLTELPFQRVDSVKCKLLFELARNATKEQIDSEEVRCHLVTDLEHQKRRTAILFFHVLCKVNSRTKLVM